MNKVQPLVLIVEDEIKLAQVLSEYLSALGYNHHSLGNGLEVIPWIKNHAPDLMLLDLMLPGKDGLSIFRDLRQFSNLPVVMITAKGQEQERLLGLELGADDYICKPYSPREVVIRVKNILHRVGWGQQVNAANVCSIAIDEASMTVWLNDISLNVTPCEFRLLRQLLKNENRIYSRGHLMNYMYEDSRVVTDRAVDSHIKNLRKKMRTISKKCDVIQSIYGVGYRLQLKHSSSNKQ